MFVGFVSPHKQDGGAERVDLWGKDLYAHLTDLYENRARFCIMLVSQYYAAKLWTIQERRAMQARAFSEQREYILPVRLDGVARRL